MDERKIKSESRSRNRIKSKRKRKIKMACGWPAHHAPGNKRERSSFRNQLVSERG